MGTSFLFFRDMEGEGERVTAGAAAPPRPYDPPPPYVPEDDPIRPQFSDDDFFQQHAGEGAEDDDEYCPAEEAAQAEDGDEGDKDEVAKQKTMIIRWQGRPLGITMVSLNEDGTGCCITNVLR